MIVRLAALSLVLPFAMAATAGEPNSPAGSPAPIEQGPPPSIQPQEAAATTAVKAPAQTQTQAQAPGPAASPTEAEKTSPVDSALGEVDIAQAAHSLGYTPRKRDDKLVYCKREAEIGTRLQHMSCYTTEEMAGVVKRSQNNKDSVSQMQRTQMYQGGGN